MILSVPVYPLTPEPDDVLAAKEQEHKSLMFADVHVRGKYPGYALRYFREHGISLEIEEADSSDRICLSCFCIEGNTI